MQPDDLASLWRSHVLFKGDVSLVQKYAGAFFECVAVVVNPELMIFMLRDGRIAQYYLSLNSEDRVLNLWEWYINEVPEGLEDTHPGRASYCSAKRTAINSCTSSLRKGKNKKKKKKRRK